MIRLPALLLVAFLNCLTLAGQKNHFPFSRLDISRGLSNNQVTFFLKDQKGFLWIGTMSGLNRYDGYQFKIFRNNTRDTTSISGDYISGIKECPGGKIWIETRSGVNIYDPLTEKFDRHVPAYLQTIGIPSNSNVSNIVKDKEGNFLFLSDSHTLYKYTVSTGKIFILYHQANENNTIANVSVDNSNQYWLIQHNGLLQKIDTKTGRTLLQTDGVTKVFGKESVYYQLFIDNDNELWIYVEANTRGLVRYNPLSGAFFHYQKNSGYPRLNADLVSSVQQDNMGNVWICTDHGGVNLYNKKENSIQYLLNNVDDEKSLSYNSISCAYKDNQGIIWLGTFKKGISYYHENIMKFPVYRHQPSNSNSLSFDDVDRFVEDEKGNLWIGTNGGGLIYFDRTNDKFTQYLHQPGNKNSISNNIIVSLLLDHKQRLWIGTYFGGLDCLENGRVTHYRNDPSDPTSLTDDRVWDIFEDSKKNLWIGTFNGLNKFDEQRGIFHHYNTGSSSPLHSVFVAVIMEDTQGKLWLGTYNGIDILDPITEKVTHFDNYIGNPNGISNNNINSLLQDSRGLVWVGTADGLNVYNSKQTNFQSFHKEDGLPDKTILNIVEDNRGQLWISSKKGVSKVSVKQTNDPDAPVSIACTNYDELDGLQGAEFNEKAALKTSKGEIIFGGPNGFNLFNPADIVPDRSKPNLVFTDLQLFNKSVGIGENVNGRIVLPQSIANTSSITLHYNENILSIEFAALNFYNPEKIKYAYKLDGFNKEWVITEGKNRKAIYTNLDPGTYLFRVKLSSDENKSEDKEISLRIKILPPFWRTPLAFLLYIIATALALWIARKITVDRTKMRLEAEHQRKEAERVQALDALKTKFFTNVSHEFRTPLSLILSPLDRIIKKSPDPEQKKQLHLVQRNAKRLLNLVNQLLDFRKMEVQEFRIHLSKDDIVQFSRDIIQSFSDISEKKDIQLEFSSGTESLFTCFDKDKLEKILFNLLSNAFKYTPPRGHVRMDIHYADNEADSARPYVVIKVSDTGIGIPPEMHDKIFERYFQHQLPGDLHNYGTGIGLAITKEFVRLHNGTISVESDQEKGTCFTVKLPVLTGEVVQNQDQINNTALIPDNDTSLRMEISENDSDTLNDHAKKKNTILIVEDNEDFRFYLKDNLKQRYRVIEAAEGKEGWKKVCDVQPDLVVSDIMMPGMNGIELSKRIKADPHTSHIPVILLTAMTTVEAELEGFQAGANDYVTKPFTFEILASRIKNMLNMQDQLRKKFQKLIEINPSEITITPVDEQFMKGALDAVEKNIDNPDFSVEDLSRELFMSRVSLYKKLLSLTGKTPIEFIRVMRLKRAAQLLKKSQMTIAEVAYEVGFNNPKIFARYFKEEFKTTPSQYQSNNSADKRSKEEPE